MIPYVEIKRVPFTSAFKLAAIGFCFSLIPFATLMGCFALFGFHTVTWNSEPVVGLKGLLASPFIGLFVALFFSLIVGTMLAVGLWIYSFFEPLRIRLPIASIIADEPANDDTPPAVS